ncbi:RagB/SusD family nutrient uptake outer membrane protein [Chitinophaga sp. SYP-B3965]|uniref:RagB/SusD family nutrient uptake outer membrane protein n=1 Tax=Chitinophaga sp. SYP-B3965 TaxID=2663120 RepID=UPI001299647A|nr:RagB/SusD family nutrient uptake outer membrane protein [Chitinophaga sp. SYP-B3965]MRG44865.1 RagB/SusD family nutrient uptake outer membrane protein [Chitinophaga sp. SYP-B3965]
MKFSHNIILVAFLLSSCGKGFVDLKPISNITTDNFYQTAEDFKNAVNGAYNALRTGGTYGVDSYIFGEIRSDNSMAVASGSVTDQDEFDRFYIRTTNPFINNRWSNSYTSIARCNAILGRIDPITMDAALKARYIAEAKFLRALFYFNLVNTFGDVPLVLKEITNSDEGYDYGRNPKEEVYAQIEKDLTEAAAALPPSYTGADIGRATKGAAQAILGRVLLTQKKYAPAAIQLKAVIDGNLYGLVLTSYADFFKVTNKNNKEAIFDVQYRSGGIGQGNSWPNSFAPQNSGNAVIQFGGGGNNVPVDDLVNDYEAGDQRKTATIATSYVNPGGTTIPGNFVKKYFDVPGVANDNGNNIPIIRYADVILMYAECLNEAGFVANGDAFTYLNDVRRRAGLGNLTAVEVPNQAAFRLTMEHERRVEFAFENLRWYDLVRTDRAITVINGKAGTIKPVNPVTPQNLVFPIPQSQIDINKTKITQNEGSN